MQFSGANCKEVQILILLQQNIIVGRFRNLVRIVMRKLLLHRGFHQLLFVSEDWSCNPLVQIRFASRVTRQLVNKEKRWARTRDLDSDRLFCIWKRHIWQCYPKWLQFPVLPICTSLKRQLQPLSIRSAPSSNVSSLAICRRNHPPLNHFGMLRGPDYPITFSLNLKIFFQF